MQTTDPSPRKCRRREHCIARLHEWVHARVEEDIARLKRIRKAHSSRSARAARRPGTHRA